MNILIYCPDPLSRMAITCHLIDLGHFKQLIAETEETTVSIALHNEIVLVLLFDPPNGRSLVDLKDFIREKRRKTRVRLLPDRNGLLMPGWREVITDALRPTRQRKSKETKSHPRFSWPDNS